MFALQVVHALLKVLDLLCKVLEYLPESACKVVEHIRQIYHPKSPRSPSTA